MGSILRKLGSPKMSGNTMTSTYVMAANKYNDHSRAIRDVIRLRYTDMPPDVVDKLVVDNGECLMKLVTFIIVSEASRHYEVTQYLDMYRTELAQVANDAALRCRCEECRRARTG